MIEASTKKRISLNEFLFVFYFCSFSFLKPLTTAAGSLSTVILLADAVIIVLIYVLYNGLSASTNGIRFVAFLGAMIVPFALTVLFFNNGKVFDHAYHFCIYGAIPLFLMIKVRDYSKVLKYWLYLTTVVGLLFVVDPLIGYKWSGGYMPLGFNQLLPAFVSCIVLWLYYKKIWAILPAAVFFVEILVYTNKGSAITAVIFTVVFFLYANKIRDKRIIGLVLGLLALGLLIYAFRVELFDMIYDIVTDMGIESYSLYTFKMMLHDSADSILSLRTDIWEECAIMISENLLFGTGIGTFYAGFGKYPHNVFLEVLVSGGIIVLIAFAMLVIASLIRGMKSFSKDKKTFFFLIFLLWIIPMQISLTLWNYAIFWIYWGMFVYRNEPEIELIEPCAVSDAKEDK